jgi:DUF1365 family protein
VRPDAAGAEPGRHPAAALLCRGQVWHARQRPVAHAFRYPCYYLRLPMRALAGRPFATGLLARNRPGLLSFHDRDYAPDGGDPVAWVDATLREHGVADADGELWLQTMPRVLGQVFNPVSFWFCERRDGALRAVLCDVRNTFGERHFYLLDTGAPIASGELLEAVKVFHVSPFCAVRGRYRFRFERRLLADGRTPWHAARIDYLDDDGLVLRTSQSGVARPLDRAGVARVFFAYPLQTLAVVVRIHWQAWRLWRRGLPFFRKPAAPAQELT